MRMKVAQLKGCAQGALGGGTKVVAPSGAPPDPGAL